MKVSHIDLLCCLLCRGPLSLSQSHVVERKNGEIEFGVLVCKNCSSLYPIINGVGVFFLRNQLQHHLNQYEKGTCNRLGVRLEGLSGAMSHQEEAQLRVEKNWSFQWNKTYEYTIEDLEGQGFFGEELFFTFIPIGRETLKNKNVIVWCCGSGKEAYHVAKHSPAVLVANEIGDEIYKIREKLPEDINLLLIRCDMTNNPLIEGWADISICDHALQHIPDHQLGFKKLLDALKLGGVAAICVYSYENNFLMTHIIEPLKSVFHRFSLKMQQALAFPAAAIIYFLIHCIYVPVSKIVPESFCNRLPLFDHMIFWAKDSFSFIWLACFDLIQAPVSYHFREREVIEMANNNNVEILKLINTHGTTWSFVGRKKGVKR